MAERTIMGLAASQAKLLSLTCRISDNELRAQSLTAAKMALASQTSEASRQYINALGTNEFIYRNYDDAGNKVYTALTGAQLSTYAPLKNQYALINTDGQVLVSELDAANYEDSSDINEFLAKYGVDPIDTGETRTIKNPEYVEAYEEWEKEYQDWLSRKPDEKIRELITPAWDEEVTDDDNELYQKFLSASYSCRSTALSGSGGSGCYLHVLAHLLDLETDDNGNPSGTYPKSYETSVSGITVSFGLAAIDGSAIYGNIDSNGVHYKTFDMAEVSDAVCNGYNGETLTATEDSQFVSRFDLTDADKNADMSQQENINKRLLSNYTIDGSGNIVLKTLKQKCIDMMYLIQRYGSLGIEYDPDMLDLLKSFEEDMSLALKRLFITLTNGM